MYSILMCEGSIQLVFWHAVILFLSIFNGSQYWNAYCVSTIQLFGMCGSMILQPTKVFQWYWEVTYWY